MSKLAKLRLGASSILLLTLGLVWMPVAVSAASEGPSDGPSRPTEQAYPNSEEQGGASPCVSRHRVKVGDTLTKIAAAYGVTINALAEENGLDDSNLIRLDQSLCIPEGGQGKQENGYAPEQNSYNQQGGSYAEPCESYKPQDNSKGLQENGYAPEQNSYNQQGGSYAKPGESYEPQDNNKGLQENGYAPEQNSYNKQGGSYAKPCESYKPQDNNKGSQENKYGTEGSGYGQEEYNSGYELKPGESAWAIQ